MAYFSRQQWGARPPERQSSHLGAVGALVVHHVGSGLVAPTDVNDAMLVLRNIQATHMAGEYSDIAYNMGVDQLGNIYELRGFQYQGGATYGANGYTKAVLWVGDSEVSTPSHAALAAIGAVYQLGVGQGHLVNGAALGGHRDYVATACPGSRLYAQLPTIRAMAGGQDIPIDTDSPLTSDGDDDLTPEQAAQLKVVADVLAPAWHRFGKAATLADAMESIYVNFTQQHQTNQQIIALLRSIDAKLSGGGGNGASAPQVVDEMARRLAG